MNSFMLQEHNLKIYKTKSDVKLNVGFGKLFDDDGFLGEESLKKLFSLDCDTDKIESYPLLITGDAKYVKIKKETLTKLNSDNISDDLELKAVPVSFYFENLNGWIFLEENESLEMKIEETGELFQLPEVGSIYQMTTGSIKKELGENYPADLMIPFSHELFLTEQDLQNYYLNSDFNNKNYVRFNGWTMEFMLVSMGEPFITETAELDQLKTSKRGGLVIQPIQILGVKEEKLGWIPLTLARARFGLNLTKGI